MAKVKKAFFCQNCGYESPKWLGQCPSCRSWNTFIEEKIHKSKGEIPAWAKSRTVKKHGVKVQKLTSVSYEDEPRWQLGDTEFNRVLGGGLVPGSLVLTGGEPGIGKSTLLLQLAINTSEQVLYVSGEESAQQIKMRAERLGHVSENCYLFTETNTEEIFTQAESLQPRLLIIDSIQTLYSPELESAPGTVSQIRHCAGQLLKYAKETGIPVILIGHITKDGSLAGPKVLEHMVDTVLQFEGDRHLVYRLLRTIKNRFGSTDELGIYEMTSKGLLVVDNPSKVLISAKEMPLSGVAVGASLEGNRPLLIEIQALVSPATYGTPQRSTTGFDAKRLNMLIAVLEKRGGLKLGAFDIFLNVAGGLKIEDPAMDLAVCAAIASSYHDIPIDSKYSFAAEVGLGGEIRGVNRVEQRISEAKRLGFTSVFLSKFQGKDLPQTSGLTLHPLSVLQHLFENLFG